MHVSITTPGMLFAQALALDCGMLEASGDHLFVLVGPGLAECLSLLNGCPSGSAPSPSYLKGCRVLRNSSTWSQTWLNPGSRLCLLLCGLELLLHLFFHPKVGILTPLSQMVVK